MLREKFNKQNIISYLTGRRKLKTDILFASLIILSTSIFIIISYTYIKNTETLINYTKAYIERNVNRMKIMLMRGLTDTEQIIGVYEPLTTTMDILDVKNNIPFLNSMQFFLDSNPQVSTAFLETNNGDYFEFSTPRIAVPYLKNLGVIMPEDTILLIKEIKNKKTDEVNTLIDGQQPLESSEAWYYVDKGNNISKPHFGEKTTFNYRKQPSYILSSKNQNLVWTDVYVFESTLRGETGISASKALTDKEGRFKGVLGVNITLRSFSDYLSKYKISANSFSYLINAKDQIVATSNLKSKIVTRHRDFFMETVKDSRENILIDALNATKENNHRENRAVIFTSNDTEYFTAFDVLEGAFNNWTLISIVPADDYIKSAKESRNTTLLMSLMILLIAFIFTYRLARRISRPITQLAEEARKIQDLNVNDRININSQILEINDLAHAISSLKTTMQSFSYYIPKKLVKQLMNRKQSIQVGGRTKEVTMMFTDIENFTTVSETLTGDKLFIYLSEYFEEMTGIIIDANGTVDNYIGDAIMSFWGAPIPDRHHIHNACRAALLCQKRLSELNRVWKREGRPVFNTRIGIHTGHAIIGNIGSSERMNYTAIGDNVNLCARLEGLNKNYGTNVMVSETVYSVAKDSFLFRHLDNVAVKGKSKAIKIYELVAQTKGDNSLLPSDELLEFIAYFDMAYKLFLTRQFSEALEAFEKINPVSHTDRSVAIYIERCKMFMESPPPKDWDGTVIMHEK